MRRRRGALTAARVDADPVGTRPRPVTGRPVATAARLPAGRRARVAAPNDSSNRALKPCVFLAPGANRFTRVSPAALRAPRDIARRPAIPTALRPGICSLPFCSVLFCSVLLYGNFLEVPGISGNFPGIPGISRLFSLFFEEMTWLHAPSWQRESAWQRQVAPSCDRLRRLSCSAPRQPCCSRNPWASGALHRTWKHDNAFCENVQF